MVGYGGHRVGLFLLCAASIVSLLHHNRWVFGCLDLGGITSAHSVGHYWTGTDRNRDELTEYISGNEMSRTKSDGLRVHRLETAAKWYQVEQFIGGGWYPLSLHADFHEAITELEYRKAALRELHWDETKVNKDVVS
jgi:hypothetical protein